MSAEGYYTTRQAAEYLGYRPGSIRRFVREGKLVPTNRVGHPRFTRAALDAFAHRGQVKKPVGFQNAILPTLHPALQQALGMK
jgi:excisionase family DNA binding protein